VDGALEADVEREHSEERALMQRDDDAVTQGVNIMAFCKEYNARTADKAGTVIPVEITVFEVCTAFNFCAHRHPSSGSIQLPPGAFRKLSTAV
jgi:hypothetical protein